MRFRRLLPRRAVAAVGAVLAHRRRPVAAAPHDRLYQMPFPCGQQWTGTTRAGPQPQPYSIDWNRPDDDGDDVVASAPARDDGASRTDAATAAGSSSPCRRRVHGLRPPARRCRRRRPGRRPGPAARPAGLDRQLHRPAPALRGGAHGKTLPPPSRAWRSRSAAAGVEELPRRAARRQLGRRRRSPSWWCSARATAPSRSASRPARW